MLGFMILLEAVSKIGFWLKVKAANPATEKIFLTFEWHYK